MSDYTRGDDTVYNGFREGWKCPCDAKEEDIELNEIVEGIDRDRLKAICEAERDGRCVVLPCKVGDTVYRVVGGFSIYTPCPVRYVTDERIKSTKRICEWIEGNDFGKTVFITRAEAEAALEGRE